jgi:hypothetical protein
MGLRDIEHKIAKKSAYQVKDAELMLIELDNLIEGFKELEKQLKKFEKKHGDDIKKNKDYYTKLSELRSELGLPEEIGVYNWKDSPSFMDKLTGKGYFDQLANDIIELGSKVKSESGGLISVAELTLKLNKNRPGKLIPPRDVIRVLESLAKDDLIQPIRTLESGVKIVEFVSIEMSDDQQKILSLASRQEFLTMEQLLIKTKWSMERARLAMDSLVEQGIALKDEQYSEGTKYWFPSLG